MKHRNTCKLKLICAAKEDRLEEVIELSTILFSDKVTLSYALVASHTSCQLDVMMWLIKHIAVDIRYSEWSPLKVTACFCGGLNLIKYIVETYKADVNLPANSGNTVLIFTCRRFVMPIFKNLFCEVSNLDVNIADSDGNTFLLKILRTSANDDTELRKAYEDVNDFNSLVKVIITNK